MIQSGLQADRLLRSTSRPPVISPLPLNEVQTRIDWRVIFISMRMNDRHTRPR
ncbi:MAG: hypothetical protein IPL71_24700 [Anaerolineales bacterium]|uniref:hypothetical protein n=1 Tax=Candidatus Villigracilis proximus TaxID=3140683 RepID=UPI003134E9DD|nr:hypothetical protein [Anaerolineales bacterium]